MPKASQHNNLSLLKPNLAKEWHSTRNASLRPDDVTPGSGKRVWWICKEGHEWEAAVYSRSKGNGCPFCNKLQETDFGDLALSKTSFVKDWHPTKNGALTPMNVTTDHGDTVWWLCGNGHEWKATVKSRTQGKGCPLCVKESFKKDSQDISGTTRQKQYNRNVVDMLKKTPVYLQTDSPGMYTGTEFRQSKRYKHNATAMLENQQSGYWIYAQMNNFSNGGMYFETETAIKPGTRVIIKFNEPLFPRAKKTYTSIVKWCRELTEEDSLFTYGIGVMYL